MAVWGIKLLTDICWYLAIIRPILSALPSVAVWIGYGLPVLYAGYVVLKMRQGVVLQFQKDVFLWQCKLLGIMTVLELVFCDVTVWEQRAAIWMFCFFAFGIFLLRITRLGEEYHRDRHFWIWNTGYLAIMLLLAVFCSSNMVVHSILWLIQTFYFHIIFPILMGILYAIAWVADKLLVILNKLLFSKIDVSLVEQVMDGFEMGESNRQWNGPETTEFPISFEMILWILGAIGVCVVVWIWYHKLLSASEMTQRTEEGKIKKIAIERPTKTQKRKGNNQEQEGVRLVYQKFLRLYRQRGLNQREHETSEEIQLHAEALWDRQELETLRSLYLRVRYGEERTEPEETEQVKKMVQRWKRGKEKERTLKTKKM